jgi:hypothetical protein
MTRIKPQTIVEKDGRRGVTVPDFMTCCLDSETPVVWAGEDFLEGIQTDTLTVVGDEGAVADPAKCGAGKGAECCIFIVDGPLGFSCERHGELRYSLIFKTMTARREPNAPFPDCQSQRMPEPRP